MRCQIGVVDVLDRELGPARRPPLLSRLEGHQKVVDQRLSGPPVDGDVVGKQQEDVDVALGLVVALDRDQRGPERGLRREGDGLRGEVCETVRKLLG